MAHAKIGRIRMKAGGAELRLIRQETPNTGGENWNGELIAFGRRMAESAPKDGGIVGYVAVAFFGNGTTCTNYKWGDESPCSRTLLPTLVSEMVRRDVVMETEARAVFSEMFEHV